MAGKRQKPPITMPVLDAKLIGRRIRRVRKMRGWNLYDLERIAGVRRETIACYECGARVPMLRNRLRLAVALHRSINFLALGKWDTRTGKTNRGPR